MRRSPLKRTGSLKRSGLRSRRRPPVIDYPARSAWKAPHAGYCHCCARFSMHLERHHIVYQQHVRAERGNEWDLANSMLLHPLCHAAHHSGQRRIKVESLPEAALAFAVDLFGEARAALYVARYYWTGRGL